jgi:hypothetical protein
MRIKSWNKFQFNENYNGQPTDPNLSLDAFDRFKNHSKEQQTRLFSILASVFSSTPDIANREINIDINHLVIQRIFKNNSGSLDVFLEFELENEEGSFNAVFKGWGGWSEPVFTTTLYKNLRKTDLYKKKLEGILKRTIEKWFEPVVDDYILEKEELEVWTSLGNKVTIYQGSKVKLIEVLTEDDKPTIRIVLNNKHYWITDLDFYFFNYWFSLAPKPTESQI